MDVTEFGIEIEMIRDQEPVALTRYLVQLVKQEDWEGIAAYFRDEVLDSVRQLFDTMGRTIVWFS